MRRRNHCRPCVRCNFGRARGVEPVIVHRDRDRIGARGGQGGAGAAIRRIFHPDRVARVQQQAGDQVQRVLRTGGDHHLIRAAVQRPDLAQIVGNRFAQGPMAHGVAAKGLVRVRPPPGAGQRTGPGVEGKGRRVRADRVSRGAFMSELAPGSISISARPARDKRGGPACLLRAGQGGAIAHPVLGERPATRNCPRRRGPQGNPRRSAGRRLRSPCCANSQGAC